MLAVICRPCLYLSSLACFYWRLGDQPGQLAGVASACCAFRPRVSFTASVPDCSLFSVLQPVSHTMNY